MEAMTIEAAPVPVRNRQSQLPVRLDSLTGLRWFAAFLVFGYHMLGESSFYADRYLLKYLFYAGSSAVSFFFILSGFVLAWSYREGDSRLRFWQRRFARIYPSHFVTFLIAVALIFWLGEQMQAPIAIANVTLTQSWLPDAPYYWWGYNGVSWSLSCEFFFYLCFPFLLPVIWRAGNRGLWAWVVGCATLIVVIPWLIIPVEHVLGVGETYLDYMLPPVRLVEFALGIALAGLVRRGLWRGPGLILSCAFAAFCLVVLVRLIPATWPNLRTTTCTVVAFTLLIAAAATADIRRRWSFFRLRQVVYLGEVSFAFYLVHEMVVTAADHLLHGGPTMPIVPAFIGLFSVALAGAIALHEFVEKPMVKLLNPRTRKVGPPVGVPGSPNPVAV